MSPANRSQKKRIPAQQLLRAKVYVNEAMTLEDRPGGVLATVPMRRPRWMVPPISWIFPYSAFRRVALDGLGSEVLSLCRGRRVEEIIEIFAATHKLSFREAQLSVTSFLRQLTERGLIAIVGMEKDAAQE